MNINLRARLILCTLTAGTFLSTAGFAQDLPTPADGSIAIGLRPLVPAQGEATRLTVTGEFPFGNGIAALDEFEVVPELVTVDLTTSWTEGTSSPDGGGSTIWAVTIDLGDLEQALSFE